jgi:hypothetical protein
VSDWSRKLRLPAAIIQCTFARVRHCEEPSGRLRPSSTGYGDEAIQGVTVYWIASLRSQ